MIERIQKFLNKRKPRAHSADVGKRNALANQAHHRLIQVKKDLRDTLGAIERGDIELADLCPDE
jgi:hypothetical protein